MTVSPDSSMLHFFNGTTFLTTGYHPKSQKSVLLAESDFGLHQL